MGTIFTDGRARKTGRLSGFLSPSIRSWTAHQARLECNPTTYGAPLRWAELRAGSGVRSISQSRAAKVSVSDSQTSNFRSE